ncbi:hypothetical protein DEF28_03895 [Marinitenerispora sediminis]|nr:hypothetical protein DEF28_03895 [Marinitenerispora sediminis]
MGGATAAQDLGEAEDVVDGGVGVTRGQLRVLVENLGEQLEQDRGGGTSVLLGEGDRDPAPA